MAKAKGKGNKGGTPSQPAPANMPAGFKVKRQVILPSLSLKENEPRTLKILEAMRVSTVKAPGAKKGKAKGGDSALPEKPATIAPVVDVISGENFTLIVPAVLEGNLKEQYPGDAYVDKTFFIMKKAKRPGKRYFDFEITEVEAE